MIICKNDFIILLKVKYYSILKMKCAMCNNSVFVIDEDYQIQYACFFYYDENNPKVLEDFDKGIITKESIELNPCINYHNNKDITLIQERYICLSCGCSHGHKFIDNIKVEYYKKLYYNRKYHPEKYIKNMKIMKTLIE